MPVAPRLATWRQSGFAKRLALKDPTWISWRDQCLASPANITRVHIVDEPFTPYLEWKIEVLYKTMFAPAGAENIYLAPSAKLSGITVPPGDFWIFDNTQVLQWRYEAGENVGGTVWNETDDISRFLKLKQVLLWILTLSPNSPYATL